MHILHFALCGDNSNLYVMVIVQPQDIKHCEEVPYVISTSDCRIWDMTFRKYSAFAWKRVQLLHAHHMFRVMDRVWSQHVWITDIPLYILFCTLHLSKYSASVVCMLAIDLPTILHVLYGVLESKCEVKVGE